MCMNSSELKGFLTGLIFGDGFIDKGVTKRAFRIKSINYDFLEYIKEQLEDCTNFHIEIQPHKARSTPECNHKEYWELYIQAHPYFSKKYHHFYDDYKHRISSKEALSWLNPIGLANWYMGDGYICLVGKTKGMIRDRRIDICTDRYSKSTVESMQKMLKNSFDLDTSIIKRNNTYRIRVLKNSYLKFYNIVFPHLVPSMQYKLYFGYEVQPKWMDNEMWLIQNKLKSAIALTDNAEG